MYEVRCQNLPFQIDPTMRESVLQTRALHALVKLSAEGNLQVHEPTDLEFVERTLHGTFVKK